LPTARVVGDLQPAAAKFRTRRRSPPAPWTSWPARLPALPAESRALVFSGTSPSCLNQIAALTRHKPRRLLASIGWKPTLTNHLLRTHTPSESPAARRTRNSTHNLRKRLIA